MYAFLILLFPIALFRHLMRSFSHTAARTTWAAAAIAIVLCACKAFLTFSYRVASASFVHEWVYNFVSLTALPAICTCAILLIARLLCRSWGMCVDAVFATSTAFLAVYLPFTTLAGPRSVYSAYELFFRPPLYLMMTQTASSCAALAAKEYAQKKALGIVCVPIMAAFLLAPSAIDTAWFLNAGNYLVPWCAYMVLSIACYIVCALKITRQP